MTLKIVREGRKPNVIQANKMCQGDIGVVTTPCSHEGLIVMLLHGVLISLSHTEVTWTTDDEYKGPNFNVRLLDATLTLKERS